MATMYRASLDCVTLVEQIGDKLRNVVPRYMQVVKGNDVRVEDLLIAEGTREWLRIFLEVNARFNGRIMTKDGFKRNPRGKDLRITEHEIGAIAEIGQWLINLHAVTEARKTGRPVEKPKAWTVRADDMIIREKIYG